MAERSMAVVLKPTIAIFVFAGFPRRTLIQFAVAFVARPCPDVSRSSFLDLAVTPAVTPTTDKTPTTRRVGFISSFGNWRYPGRIATESLVAITVLAIDYRGF